MIVIIQTFKKHNGPRLNFVPGFFKDKSLDSSKNAAKHNK